MSDWSTISSLATAGGTLVLGVATFASVRSSNRSARVAEFALQEQRRAILVHSRITDPPQKIAFVEGRWVKVPGGSAVVEEENGVIYLVLSLRNVGSGIGVLQGWRLWPDPSSAISGDRPAVEDFRPQTRDLYIPGGDVGLWQAALRDDSETLHGQVSTAVAAGRSITVDLLYSDQLGGQRTISRFGVLEGDGGHWLIGASRHWYLDSDAPR